MKLLSKLEAASSRLSARLLVARLWGQTKRGKESTEEALRAMSRLLEQMEAIEATVGSDKAFSVTPHLITLARSGRILASAYTVGVTEHASGVLLSPMYMAHEAADAVFIMGASDSAVPGRNTQPG